MNQSKSFDGIAVAVRLAEQWCQGIDSPFAISVDSTSRLTTSVNQILSETKVLRGSVWEALVWLRVGQIARAHEIVQDAGSGIEAYIHGMIHRLEGDYWNAKYWFRSAGRSIVAAVVQHVASQSNMADPAAGRLENRDFDPNDLVDRLERFHETIARGSSQRPGTPRAEELKPVPTASEKSEITELLAREWWAVWNFCKP